MVDAPAATVVHIFVAPERGAPVRSMNSVQAVAEPGLVGDRYHADKNRRAPDYQVTLIELENIEAFTEVARLSLTPDQPRRNIVTQGIRLNGLVGKRFKVGSAVFEGLDLCEPCSLFAKRTYREVLKGFAGRGGLRARIVSSGEIRVGDSLMQVSS